MTKEIIIVFEKNGDSTVETKGIKGTSCTNVSGFLESALGKTIESKKTREYFETAGVHASITR